MCTPCWFKWLLKNFQKKKSHTQPKSHDNDNVDKNAGPPTGGDNPGSGHTENEQIAEPRPKRSKRLKSTSDDKEQTAGTDNEKLADEAENNTTHDDTEEIQVSSLIHPGC